MGYSGDASKILPCGWSWKAAVNTEIDLVLTGQSCSWPKDLKNLVYGTYCFTTYWMYGTDPGWSVVRHVDAMRDPQPMEPSKGFCFMITGTMVQIKGRKVKVSRKKELSNGLKGWEKSVTVRLARTVHRPDTGGLYVFKGLLEPFTKDEQDAKFMAKVCERVEETS
jgi:hypothetical protein